MVEGEYKMLVISFEFGIDAYENDTVLEDLSYCVFRSSYLTIYDVLIKYVTYLFTTIMHIDIYAFVCRLLLLRMR